MVDKRTTCSSFDATAYSFHPCFKLHPLCCSFTHRSRQGYPLRGGSLHSKSNPHSEPKGMTASCALRQESPGQGTRRSQPEQLSSHKTPPSPSSKACSFLLNPSLRCAKNLCSSTVVCYPRPLYLSDIKGITKQSNWTSWCFLLIHYPVTHALVRLTWRFHAIPS
jgi:hypothetical protein